MKYFTISEMLKSDTAIKRGIWNGASRAIEDNLIALVDVILDPLRERYGKPVTVTSGYRCEKVNTLIGGAKTSQHMKGEAADISVGGREANRQLARLIVSMGLPFDQLIDEEDYAWIHVSYTRGRAPRKQILRYRNKVYKQINASEL